MLFCQLCRVEEDWPESTTLVDGRCEVCGETKHCNNEVIPNTGVPLSDEQIQRARRMGPPRMAVGEELTYLPRALDELEYLRGLFREIYGKANVGSVPLDPESLRDSLNDIAMQIRTTPGFGPRKVR